MTALFERSRVLRTLAILRAQLQRQQRGYEAMARPVLSANGEMALRGGGEGAADVLKVWRPDAMVYLQYRFPLENRTATANVRRTGVQIRQVELGIEDASLSLQAMLRRLAPRVLQCEQANRRLTQIETSQTLLPTADATRICDRWYRTKTTT